MIQAISRAFPVVALSVVLSGCATTAALRSGQTAETLQEYDRAVIEYTKVLQKSPNNRDARQGLERAKVRAAQDLPARRRPEPEQRRD
jgi:hypothetical protein